MDRPDNGRNQAFPLYLPRSALCITGLSKREYFALHIFCAIVPSDEILRDIFNEDQSPHAIAVSAADALLDELNK